MIAQTVIDLARECVGTPFRHQARVCGVGMDCAGVLVHIFERLGLDYTDEVGYPRRPYEGQLEAGLLRQPHLELISKTDLQAGDVVLFRIKKEPQHIGIFTGETLIHAYFSTGRVVEQRFDPWRNQITHAYRVVL